MTTGLKAQSPCRSWLTKTTTVHQSVHGIISVNQWVSEYVSESLSWQLVLKVKRDIKTKLRLLWRNSPFQNVDGSSCRPWGPRNWLQFKNCQAPNNLGDLASPCWDKLQDSPSLGYSTNQGNGWFWLVLVGFWSNWSIANQSQPKTPDIYAFDSCKNCHASRTVSFFCRQAKVALLLATHGARHSGS